MLRLLVEVRTLKQTFVNDPLDMLPIFLAFLLVQSQRYTRTIIIRRNMIFAISVTFTQA
jgi:hypothetical protein